MNIDKAIEHIKPTRFWWTDQVIQALQQAKKDKEEAIKIVKKATRLIHLDEEDGGDYHKGMDMLMKLIKQLSE